MTKLLWIFSFLVIACSSRESGQAYLDSIHRADSIKSLTNYHSSIAPLFDTIIQPDYQNELPLLGIGVCLIKQESFPIYRDTLEKPDFVSLYAPDSAGVLPVLFKPDYGIFYMVVLRQTGSYYCVQKNVTDSAFVSVAQVEEFKDWGDLLLNAPGITNNDWNANPPLVDKESNQHVDTFDMKSTLQVIDFSNDWVQVENGLKQKAWIRWKLEEHLLVRILLLE